ncbi:cytidylyltransferase domain-containing protein [Robertmurraya korlensis]|uniref:cytidylyltransferase domain-containing protein n=1 Tax=Robertmurraya korlensis TaxID=519977 RepID=UPI000825911D|nr:glycosyltransferase family protein [Robertmurraya korlensis]
MKVVAIIQARMGSTRLPGKVLKKVRNKSLLEYQLERVKKATLLHDIVIATTINKRDEEIVNFCKARSIPYYRGSEEDVLTRYYEAARMCNADVIVRLTSDCPLVDPSIIDRNVAEFLSDPSLDYVSNTIERTYPRGMDIEVFSISTLERLRREATSPSEREHVTSFLTRNPNMFQIKQVKQSNDDSQYRLTVDTQEDFFVIKNVIENLYMNSPMFSTEEVVNYLKKMPDIVKINQDIKQKEL